MGTIERHLGSPSDTSYGYRSIGQGLSAQLYQAWDIGAAGQYLHSRGLVHE
ncbi:MAG: hypothetical protein PUK59_02795 [Actinomycetaceae bacterium]|nr:hypothetical protein [Actinomycetaceae bacterium]MDY5855371.1 hypothetical protein [Arcanobacterium sp.]